MSVVASEDLTVAKVHIFLDNRPLAAEKLGVGGEIHSHFGLFVQRVEKKTGKSLEV